MYKFQREDTGEIVEVDFEKMMEQDTGGYITLEIDGQKVAAKRVHDEQRTSSGKAIVLAGPRKIISDLAFGCFDNQVNDYREDAKRHGFTDINFVPEADFAETGFYQVECTSPEQWKRYVKHRNSTEGSGKNGSALFLSQEELDDAKERTIRTYGQPRRVIAEKK